MANVVRASILAIIALISGCTLDAAKRTTFETLQNVRQRECLNNSLPDCEKRESYDEYERKRKELDSPK